MCACVPACKSDSMSVPDVLITIIEFVLFAVSQLLPVKSSKAMYCPQPLMEVCLDRCIAAVHLHAQ